MERSMNAGRFSGSYIGSCFKIPGQLVILYRNKVHLVKQHEHAQERSPTYSLARNSIMTMCFSEVN